MPPQPRLLSTMRFHTHLPVDDIQKTQDFYTVLLGANPVKRKPDYVKFLTPELNIAFSNHNPVPSMTQVHLGFEVETQDALDHLRARLIEAGLPIENHETTACCYATQDKFWITDPDGYRWEIYRILGDAEQFVDENSSCCKLASITA